MEFKEFLPQEAIVPMDYDNPKFPDIVRELKPTVFSEGNAYCCITGEDPMIGIFGCGETPELALLNWVEDYNKRNNAAY